MRYFYLGELHEYEPAYCIGIFLCIIPKFSDFFSNKFGCIVHMVTMNYNNMINKAVTWRQNCENKDAIIDRDMALPGA